MSEWLKPKPIVVEDVQVVEPIDLAEAVDYLNIFDFEMLDEEDPKRAELEQKIMDTVRDARAEFENLTDHIFALRGFALFRGRPAVPFVELPVYPVQEIATVMYLDRDGQLQEWPETEWEASIGSEANPATLRPKPGRTWPPMLCCTDRALQVNVVAGYDPSEMPVTAVRAMKMLLSHFWNNDGVTSLREVHAMPYAFQTIMINCQRPSL